MKIDLIGQHGQSESVAVLDKKLQNWYLHIEQGGKAQFVLFPTPGLSAFAITPTGPTRGMLDYNDLLYVVSADTLWEIDSGGNTTNKGTLTTSTGRVSMAHNGPDNGGQLFVVDGTNGYIYDSDNDTFYRADNILSATTDGTTANHLIDSGEDFAAAGVAVGQRVYNDTDGTTALITAVALGDLTLDADIFTSGENYTIGDADFPNGATHVEHMDGYFLANYPTVTGRFYISSSYDGTQWDSLDFATAERNSDPLQAIKVSKRLLWLIGSQSAEAWWNTGDNANFPFTPAQAGYSEWGTPAPYSVAEMAGSIFYLAQNTEGTGQVVMTNGMNPVVISTTAIATEISALSTISDAYGYTYQHNGHNFYVLSFPTEGKTYVYDLTTQSWHTWNSYATNGQHRSTDHVFIFGKHLVGDSASGRVFELDWDAYTDFGDTITRVFRTRSIHTEDKRLRHNALWLDMQEGVGDFTTTDPQIMMRFRDDAGLWSNEKWRSIGAVGKYRTRVIWRMLGRSLDRVYEFKITDPVKPVIMAVYLDLEQESEEIR